MEIGNILSKSLISYLQGLYVRIISNLGAYRRRLDLIAENLKSFSGTLLTELNSYLKESESILFGEFPILFISVLDRFICFEENDENPDLVDIVFGMRQDVSNFRRNISLLEKKTEKLTSGLNTLILTRPYIINSFSKKELMQRLISTKNEEEFRKEVLIPILNDLDSYRRSGANCAQPGGVCVSLTSSIFS